MNTAKIERIIDPKRAAKVEYDKRGAHLHTLNNGFQWSGAAIYSVEVAEAAIEVLQDYVKLMKEDELEGYGDIREMGVKMFIEDQWEELEDD